MFERSLCHAQIAINYRIIMHLLLSLAAVLTLLAVSGGSWFFWSPTPPALIPSGRYLALAAVVSLLAGFLYAYALKRQRPRLEHFASPHVWTLGLVAIFCSAWMCRPYSFFQAPWFRKEIVIAALVAYALSYSSWKRFFIALPVLTAVMSIGIFLNESGGQLLFVDDHAMFIFRLKLLK
jgi:hypothetical protein